VHAVLVEQQHGYQELAGEQAHVRHLQDHAAVLAGDLDP
jgi:hypothetical protein